MSLRHALPPHASVLGIQWLPPNHGLLRLALVQSMPIPLRSASLSTLVNQSSFASTAPKGTSTWKPMNEVHGAWMISRQKYSSSGSVALGMGLPLTTWVALAGTSAGRMRPCPFGLGHGNRNRFPAWNEPCFVRTVLMLTAPAR